MTINHLHRVRWAVRGTLALGVAASVAANVLHARDNPVSQAIAAWPPLALLLTVELIWRVPVTTPTRSRARIAATAAIAAIAAWVSYWHMVAVAVRYGETGASPYLMPLSVDGLMVVATVCLVELYAGITGTTPAPTETAPALPAVPPAPALTLRDGERLAPTMARAPFGPEKPAPRRARVVEPVAKPRPVKGRTGLVGGVRVPVPEDATVVDDRIVSGAELDAIAQDRYLASVAAGAPLSQRALGLSFDPPFTQTWGATRIRRATQGEVAVS